MEENLAAERIRARHRENCRQIYQKLVVFGEFADKVVLTRTEARIIFERQFEVEHGGHAPLMVQSVIGRGFWAVYVGGREFPPCAR